MRVPLEISTRNVELTEAIEELIREKAKKLDTFYDQVISCRVMVEIPHRSKQTGASYNVRVDMTVPGAELVAKRAPHADLHVAVVQAFDAAARQLKEHAAKQRREVKVHPEKPMARIEKLFPEEGYGFLVTPEGSEIYFHRNSVVNTDFEALEVGMTVSYVQELGEKGAQASTVMLE